MSAPPYMPLYVADYLADTTHLTCEEHGAYSLLLMHMHQQGGSLSADDKTLAFLAKVTPKQWSPMRETVLEFFTCKGRKLVIADRFLCHVWQAPERRPYVPGWEQMRAAVIERDGFRCAYCETEDGPFEADHVLSVARGGDDSLDNLVCACRTCNRSKGAKLLSEWRA